MPHLACILDCRDGPQIPATLGDRWTRLLSVQGVDYCARTWSDDHFLAVNLVNPAIGDPDQPAVSSRGDAILFLDGHIHNLDKLRNRINRNNGHGSAVSAPQVCLALFDEHGESFFSWLDGDFNLVIYRPAERSVLLFNDRWGYRPFFWMRDRGRFLFASERKAILAAAETSAAMEPQSILELFALGHHLGDRTLFKDIHALPQASIASMDAQGVHLRQYWRPEYRTSGAPLSLADAAHELGDRLVRATALRVAPQRRIGIFLSGGLDSRAVAGALAQAAPDVVAFTFGAETSPDVQYARQIAQGLGFVHHRIGASDQSMASALPRVVWRIEGAVPFHQCTSIQNHYLIRPEAQIVFNGHFGDALTGGHILPQQFFARSAADIARHILAKRCYMRLPQLQHIFNRQFLAGAYPTMLETLEHELLVIAEERPPLLYNLWDLTVRQRRFTFSSPAIDRYLFEQVTPLVDTDVVDWALQLPLRYLLGQRAYRRMILDCFPRIRHVPWARTGRRIPRTLFGVYAAQGRRFLQGRLKRFFSKPAAATPALPLQAPALRHRIEQYLDSGHFPSDIFDAQAIRELLDAHFDRGENWTYAVSDLLTVAESSRLFIESSLHAPPAEVQPMLDLAPVSSGAA